MVRMVGFGVGRHDESSDNGSPHGDAPAICPSARVLIEAICAQSPGDAQTVLDMAAAHLAFVTRLGELGQSARAMSSARRAADEALAWALKGVGDRVLYPAFKPDQL